MEKIKVWKKNPTSINPFLKQKKSVCFSLLLISCYYENSRKKVFGEISTLAQSHEGDTAFCVWLTAAGTLPECRCCGLL